MKRGGASSGHVSGRFLDDLLQMLSRNEVDVPPLLEGLGIEREALRRGHPYVEWDVFAEVMERLEDQVGGPDALEKLGRGITEMKPAAILRRLAGFSASPERLIRAGERWALRRAIPPIETRIETLGADHLRVTCAVPDELRPCPPLFYFSLGLLRATPRILGLPEAIVEAEVQGSRVDYDVLLPRSTTLGARLGRAVRALFSARAAFDQLEQQQGEAHRHFLELRAASDVLQESEGRYRALTEAAVDLVIEVGDDGRITYASPSCEEPTGLQADELIGQPFTSFMHPEEAGQAEREFHGRGEMPYDKPIVRVRHVAGGYRAMEAVSQSYFTREGQERVVAILRDVSERVRVEEERRRHQQELEQEVARRTRQLERRNRELRELQSLLLQAERLGTARDLSGQLAHSINNPLGALIGHLQLALHTHDDPHRALEDAVGLATKLREVVVRILALYREGKVDRAPVAPREILRDVEIQIEGQVALHEVEVVVRCGPGLPELQADGTLLGSALTALAQNAVESLEKGGRLVLSAERSGDRDEIAFCVADNGPGIPAELHDKVFDPFFTTKRTGSGLGLAIARGVVLGHSGEIELRSRPEVDGTQVRVRIPVASPVGAGGGDGGGGGRA